MDAENIREQNLIKPPTQNRFISQGAAPGNQYKSIKRTEITPSPVGIAISVVVTQQVVFAHCLVTSNLQWLVNG